MYNKCVLMGRLTKSPELRKTKKGKDGKSVCNFSIAVNRRFDRETADFFNCTAWGKTAEFVNEYFDKGQPILVEGQVESREYVDKEGGNHRIVEIVVETVSFTGSKAE